MVQPKEGERYYLRLLLHHVISPKSFDDLKKVNDIVCETYKEACQLRGLLKTDNEWFNCLKEAVNFKFPKKLRWLFSTILIWCQPENPLQLWETFRECLTEDFNDKPNR
jgi:hypothetical protein